MSIAILVTVNDGIVLAADSASTLTALQPQPNAQGQQSQPKLTVVNVYNNANKIVNLYKGLPVGCVAYGSGSIGNASISTLLKDFRKRLVSSEERFGTTTYTMEDVTKRLFAFLMDQVSNLGASDPKPTLGIMLGGYSAGQHLPEGWKLMIENGIAKPPQPLRPAGQIGLSWGGEGESIARLVLGFSNGLPQILFQVIKPTPSAVDMQNLVDLLRNSLQAPLVFAPMPIQDAIELAEWLVCTASMFSRFWPGPSLVGGPTESAAITKHEGFKWIHRKHYYESKFNPEVRNGDQGRKHES